MHIHINTCLVCACTITFLMFAISYSCVCHDAFMCVSWLRHMRATTHLYVYHVTVSQYSKCTCVRWLTYARTSSIYSCARHILCLSLKSPKLRMMTTMGSMRIYMCVCVCVCVYIYVCVYIHVYIQTLIDIHMLYVCAFPYIRNSYSFMCNFVTYTQLS